MPNLKYTSRGPLPYIGPVALADSMNPRAHGGTRWTDTRVDGATRERLINGAHREIGPWR